MFAGCSHNLPSGSADVIGTSMGESSVALMSSEGSTTSVLLEIGSLTPLDLESSSTGASSKGIEGSRVWD